MPASNLDPSPEVVQRQLEEKDQLIQALTERLSEVVDQLDRAQRSGADRGGSRSGGASGEILEQNRVALDNLSALLERWEEVQPQSAFLRLEARLDHLRELLEAGVAGAPAPRESAPAPRTTPLHEPPRSQAPDVSSEKQTKQSMLSGWEAMKAQLLGAEGGKSSPRPRDEQTEFPPAPAPPPAASEPATAIERSTETSVSVIEESDLPHPIDLATAEREDLERAIESRDRFISQLTKRLRSEQLRTREAINWDALNNAPQELRARLQALEADLQDRLRIAEVELSLERARLSRVQSRTEELQRQIEGRLRAGRTREAAAAEKLGEGESSSPKNWLNHLRRK